MVLFSCSRILLFAFRFKKGPPVKLLEIPAPRQSPDRVACGACRVAHAFRTEGTEGTEGSAAGGASCAALPGNAEPMAQISQIQKAHEQC